jgi:uncharacterized membrane protein YoaK (UPF0700 family)
MSAVLLALLYLLVVIVIVLGSIADEHIRTRTAREGHLVDLAREIIRWWRR